jgi:26S proteasome regulatory subunit N3
LEDAKAAKIAADAAKKIATPTTVVIDTTKKANKSDESTEKTEKIEKVEKPKEVVVDTSIAEFYPEVEIYLSLLVLVFKMDTRQLPAAQALADALLTRLESYNRRTLDSLSAKVFFYYSRVYELLGTFDEIRSKLFALHRTSVLRHNVEGQVSLLNLLLRNYIAFNLYDQANKLVSNVEFKESHAASNEIARYYYYQGRILSIDPEKYAQAYEYLQQALRKAPSQGARGFRVAVLKLSVIVQLLMGDIPERPLFHQKGLIVPLQPYMQLTQAVRFGDLTAFTWCLNEYNETFQKDKTLALILRLRNNVLKTGLRKINLSYSRISLKDIAKKLLLDSEEDAEFIVAKAIKERIIDATIHHAEGFVTSNETTDVYSTKEPQEQFHLRTDFFLKIHNDAMKAMRYIPDSGKKKEENDDLNQKLKDEEDLAAALAEEDDLDDFY